MGDIVRPAGIVAVKHKDMGDGSHAELIAVVNPDGSPIGGGAGADRELVVSTYLCKTAFTGASIGDTITATQVIDVSAAPTTISTVWHNQTTAADLLGAPSAANLSLVGTTALTDAQMRASPVGVQAQARVCLGSQLITGLSSAVPASLTVPANAVVAEIQADGGIVRMRRDAGNPTATQGWRIDDGVGVTVDSTLANVRLLAQSGATTNVQIAYFDRV